MSGEVGLTVRLEFEGEAGLFRAELGDSFAESIGPQVSLIFKFPRSKETYCPLVASGPKTLPTCSTPPSTTTLLSAGFIRRSKTE